MVLLESCRLTKGFVPAFSDSAVVIYAANMSSPPTNIESLQHEDRVFSPPAEFAAKAHIKSMEELERCVRKPAADPEKFWARMAESELHWFKKWDTVLKWEAAARAVVRRRQNQHLLQLSRSASDRPGGATRRR